MKEKKAFSTVPCPPLDATWRKVTVWVLCWQRGAGPVPAASRSPGDRTCLTHWVLTGAAPLGQGKRQDSGGPRPARGGPLGASFQGARGGCGRGFLPQTDPALRDQTCLADSEKPIVHYYLCSFFQSALRLFCFFLSFSSLSLLADYLTPPSLYQHFNDCSGCVLAKCIAVGAGAFVSPVRISPSAPFSSAPLPAPDALFLGSLRVALGASHWRLPSTR